MKYIHYGHEKFEIKQFNQVQNKNYMTKPYGGLWASWIDADAGWKDWCLAEEFDVEKLEKSFEFVLAKDANILDLQCPADLESLPRIKQTWFSEDLWCILDFEKLALTYDAIRYWRINDKLYWLLYGWDCDSILILNPEVIIT